MLPNKWEMERIRKALERFTPPEERQNLLGLLPRLEGLAGQVTADGDVGGGAKTIWEGE